MEKVPAEMMREFVRSQKFTSTDEVMTAMKNMFKDILQEVMECELADELGYEKSERTSNNECSNKSKNYRNGYSKKTIKTQMGELDIKVPRDRNGEYEPKIIGKYNRNADGMEEEILSLDACGMSQRDIAEQIKNLYDDFPELHIAFTGSSLLEILNGRADLSRRTLVYELTGLSFREYLSLIKAHDFPIFTLEEILKNNEQISAEIASKIKPFEFFDDYLSFGYYPYFLEGKDDYFNRLNETLNMILEVELPMLRGLEIAYIPRIKKLLAVIGESAPFIPNITQLAAKIGISRQTLLIYLKYLEDAKLINQLYKKSRGLSVLEKPEKILMENTNLIELFNGENANTGSRRETFVLNQLLHSHKVDFSEESDFFVDSKYTFKVGGKNKKRKQIQEIPDSYIIADDIEFGTDRRIPIWLLGFMY